MVTEVCCYRNIILKSNYMNKKSINAHGRSLPVKTESIVSNKQYKC